MGHTIGPATQVDVTAKIHQVLSALEFSTSAVLTAALSLPAQMYVWTASTSAPSMMWRSGPRVLKESSIWRLSGLGRQSQTSRSKFDGCFIFGSPGGQSLIYIFIVFAHDRVVS